MVRWRARGDRRCRRGGDGRGRDRRWRLGDRRRRAARPSAARLAPAARGWRLRSRRAPSAPADAPDRRRAPPPGTAGTCRAPRAARRACGRSARGSAGTPACAPARSRPRTPSARRGSRRAGRARARSRSAHARAPRRRHRRAPARRSPQPTRARRRHAWPPVLYHERSSTVVGVHFWRRRSTRPPLSSPPQSTGCGAAVSRAASSGSSARVLMLE